MLSLLAQIFTLRLLSFEVFLHLAFFILLGKGKFFLNEVGKTFSPTLQPVPTDRNHRLTYLHQILCRKTS